MPEIKNRKAYFDYYIEETFEAGMVLQGTEVKSLRQGNTSFNEAFCYIHKGEVWIKSLYIGPYEYGTHNNHNPLRERKLLLKKKEILKLEQRMKEKGYTLVPLRIYFNEKNIAKIEIALVRGKKKYDKRETIKKREAEMQMKRFIK
ncbi:MAG: SsrA-binding protein SmpB [Chitinophagaceae bacterium]|nr:SsrA-binding protein SmpB [Chitinophagaceae bacterium]